MGGNLLDCQTWSRALIAGGLNRTFQVLKCDDEERRVTWIITIYEPDPDQWTNDFKWKPSWKSTENTWKQDSS